MNAEKILLVEDDDSLGFMIQDLLSLNGYKVHLAKDGKEGLLYFNKSEYDLCLVDIMMPKKDGFSLVEDIKKINPEIPVIFLTARNQKDDKIKGLKLGADDYITKPFDDVELLDAIELRLKKSERLKKSFDKESSEGLNGFFQEVKGYEAFQKLSENRETRHYRKRDVLYEEGDYPKQLFYINSGRIKTFKSTSFGKELIIEVYKKGDFVGFIPLIQAGKYTESAATMEDCEVSIIPKKDFQILLSGNTNVTAQLVKMLADNVVEKEEQLLKIAYDSVRRKVADALLSLAIDFDAKGHAEFSILRDDLASMVGTAKETVIRTLSEFREDGLINMKGSKITVLNKKELEDMPY